SLMARLDRLQPFREVAQTAAVIGRSFDHRTIAALAGRPEAVLAEAMDKLVEAELIFRRGTPPDATYLFKHALVRDAAYESLLKARRSALHARLLDVLERQGDVAPEVKAQHAEPAGLTERALGYWEQAGAEALAKPAYKEAIASFENAIRLCRALGAAEQWKRREQALQLQLGQALIANQGYPAPATLRAFDRALALAEGIGDPSLQLPALYGKWAARYVAGADTEDDSRQFLVLAERLSETGPRVVGLRLVAMDRFCQGRFTESLALLREAIAGYDPVAHRDLVSRFGHDPRAAASSYLSWNLWILGFPDEAARTIHDNGQFLNSIDHVNSKFFARYHHAITDAWLRRPDRIEATARELMRVASEMMLPFWHALYQILLGWALSQQGTASGLPEIEDGVRRRAQLGANLYQARQAVFVAEAYARAGRYDESRACIAKVFASPVPRDFRAFAGELHRMRAKLMLNAGDDAAAEADLRRALDISRGQDARSFELRAARDLARLLGERGERRQGADLLEPIYAWFTEGFGTADLIEAKVLLEELR
ncbi:MAG: hypothetical protein JNK67_29110, partial [Alphaproteobacteria bacterium]|nr:hypothetical protein [Alphaproteobacteria bacterium]